LKNQTVKKNRLNQLKFSKNWPVQFDFSFINLKPKKLNRTEPKPKKTKKNRVKLDKNQVEPNKQSQTEKPSQTGLNRFLFFKKKLGFVIFFYKNRTEPKMITPISHHHRCNYNYHLIFILLLSHHNPSISGVFLELVFFA
jgi:hypothetical protein